MSAVPQGSCPERNPIAEMPFDQLHFRFPWRPYQERVLDAVDAHLNDRKIHVVAAPGAGKTTLGLEIFRRLKQRALVLSPTRVIRDQWIQRLQDFTVSAASDPEWVSRDLYRPKILTSVTYQALHMQCIDDLETADEEPSDREGEQAEKPVDAEGLTRLFREHSIGVLILDEAHHLRSEWWRALNNVCAGLPELILVSLTATPPYDVVNSEWIRYEQLCGPIDEEISVPELVKAGTLCPHQDFVWAVRISAAERARVKQYDAQVSALCHSLFRDPDFDRLVSGHRWLSDTVVAEEVLEEPNVAIALLVIVKAKDWPTPATLMALLDLTERDVPELGRRWWQILIEALLFSKSFVLDEEGCQYVDRLKKQLRSTGLLKDREVSIERSRRLERSLALSGAKIQACVAIHALECKYRGDTLRQVVLTDFIRDEVVDSGLDCGPSALGAWPIFAALIGASNIPAHVALLSGRWSIVHVDLLDTLRDRVPAGRLSWKKLDFDERFCSVSGPLNTLTGVFTDLLAEGKIKTLVGTRALLGEGWDAPAVNSLILASAVGSFMSTNQMRGRAIRVDRKVPGKVSAIWHLVAIDLENFSGLSDLADLGSRFETFVGLSEKKNTIESGFARMATFGGEMQTPDQRRLAALFNNWKMVRRYRKCAALGARWQTALIHGAAARMAPGVAAPRVPEIRRYHLLYTLKRLLLPLAAAFLAVTFDAVSSIWRGLEVFWVLLSLGFLGVVIYRLPTLYAALKILIRHLPVDGSIKQIALAVNEALCRAGYIKTPFRSQRVRCVSNADGTFFVTLVGATYYESSLFADCFAEVLAPIDNPRYLVVRSGSVLGLKRDDYHAVPSQLAVKKDYVNEFAKAWSKHVGPVEVIYTRSEDGRKALLKARVRAFSASFAHEVKRLDRWQ